MSFYQANAGAAFSARTRLTTTLQTMDVSSANSGTNIPKIRLANLTGSPVAVDVEVHDASSSWALLKAGPVPANGSLEIYDTLLAPGETLKAKAASNNAIDIHVIAGVYL